MASPSLPPIPRRGQSYHDYRPAGSHGRTGTPLEHSANQCSCNFFRHGEGWHTPETYATVERLGFLCDSTAIPGRVGAAGHPMNWESAPNRPYFPSSDDLRKAGPERALLELPMNTWLVEAPYDATPRIRYINPAVHPKLFANALQDWENTRKFSPSELHIWVMIFSSGRAVGDAGRGPSLFPLVLCPMCEPSILPRKPAARGR